MTEKLRFASQPALVTYKPPVPPKDAQRSRSALPLGFTESWKQLATEGDSRAKRLVHAYQHRPAEELYDCQSDPWNRNNLIDDSSVATVRDELRSEQDAWIQQQGDAGQATELKAFERMPRRQP